MINTSEVSPALDLAQTSIIWLTPTKEQLNFKVVADIKNTAHFPVALQTARLFQQAIDPKDCNLNFKKALDLVRADPSLALIGSHSDTTTPAFSTASQMVDKILTSIQAILGAMGGADIEQVLRKLIESAFIHMRAEESAPWVYWLDKSASKVVYTYNLLFVFQNETTGGIMAIIPVALKITIDISQQQLFELKLEEKHNFGLELKAITVVRALA